MWTCEDYESIPDDWPLAKRSFQFGVAAFGALYDNRLHMLTRGQCTGDWEDGIFDMALEAINYGLGCGYAGRALSPKERCIAGSRVETTIDSSVGKVAVMFAALELAYGCFCRGGDNFIMRRLGPGTGWAWWIVVVPALYLAFVACTGLVYDFVLAKVSWYVVLPFAVWELMAFVYCCWIVVQGKRHSAIWARTQCVCLDIPDFVAMFA